MLGVYTGSAVNALTTVASNNNSCGAQSQVGFTATMGTAYRIAVDGSSGATGNIDLDIVHAPPANDNFPGTTLSGLPISGTGSNVGATKQAGEPNHAGNSGGASVWYSWTAPSSGPVTVDTCESDFDTLLGVYTGAAVNSLTGVASNDDSCGTRSQVGFAATMGTTYRIAVDGSNGQTGNVDLDIASTPPPSPTFTPSSLAFGDQQVGTTSFPQPVTIGNTGQTQLEVTGRSIVGTNPGDFAISGGTCGTSFTLDQGQSCTVEATFTPAAVGARSAQISFTDNAPGSPHDVGLSGTGFTPSPPDGSGVAPAVAAETGERAAAIKKCKKKYKKNHDKKTFKKCKKKANKLPV